MTSRFSAQIAVEIAHGVARRSTPELLRSGANEVYAVDDLVIRIAPPGTDVAAQAMGARWQAGQRIAVPTFVDSGTVHDQPYMIWERVRADPGVDIDFRALGSEVVRLHQLDPVAAGDTLALPWCDEATWLDLDAGPEAAEAANVVESADIELLRVHWGQLCGWGARCRPTGNLVECNDDRPAVPHKNVLWHHCRQGDRLGVVLPGHPASGAAAVGSRRAAEDCCLASREDPPALAMRLTVGARSRSRARSIAS